MPITRISRRQTDDFSCTTLLSALLTARKATAINHRNERVLWVRTLNLYGTFILLLRPTNTQATPRRPSPWFDDIHENFLPETKKIMSTIYVWKQQNFCSRFSTKRNLMGIFSVICYSLPTHFIKIIFVSIWKLPFYDVWDIAIYFCVRLANVEICLRLPSSFFSSSRIYGMLDGYSRAVGIFGVDLEGFDCCLMCSGSDWKVNYACLMCRTPSALVRAKMWYSLVSHSAIPNSHNQQNFVHSSCGCKRIIIYMKTN